MKRPALLLHQIHAKRDASPTRQPAIEHNRAKNLKKTALLILDCTEAEYRDPFDNAERV